MDGKRMREGCWQENTNVFERYVNSNLVCPQLEKISNLQLVSTWITKNKLEIIQ